MAKCQCLADKMFDYLHSDVKWKEPIPRLLTNAKWEFSKNQFFGTHSQERVMC
jgi:hypothetical protein